MVASLVVTLTCFSFSHRFFILTSSTTMLWNYHHQPGIMILLIVEVCRCLYGVDSLIDTSGWSHHYQMIIIWWWWRPKINSFVTFILSVIRISSIVILIDRRRMITKCDWSGHLNSLNFWKNLKFSLKWSRIITTSKNDHFIIDDTNTHKNWM